MNQSGSTLSLAEAMSPGPVQTRVPRQREKLPSTMDVGRRPAARMCALRAHTARKAHSIPRALRLIGRPRAGRDRRRAAGINAVEQQLEGPVRLPAPVDLVA